MNEVTARESQLLRLVGEARGTYSPQLTAAAERELARRAGGTRRQAERRIRVSGASIILVGLILAGLAAGLYAMVVIVWGPQRGLTDASATCGLTGLFGLAVAGLGLAVLLLNRWVLGKARCIPLLRKADVEVAAYEPDTAELLRTMRASRAGASPQVPEKAEGELRERLEKGRARLEGRVKSWGVAAVALGALMVFNGVAVVLLLLVLQALVGTEPELGGQYMLSSTDVVTTWIGAAANAILGAAVLLGGVGLLGRWDWGRKAILWAVWASFAVTLLAGLVAAALMVARSGLNLRAVLSVVGTLVTVLVWLAICWGVTRALRRPEVKEACGVETPLPRGLR